MSTLRVLVGCEFSGKVRRAFRARGHDAWSVDLLDSDDHSPYHIKGDLREVLDDGWDIGIFHPPCTHTAVSGARHFAAKRESGEQQAALDFVGLLLSCSIPKTALEQPVSIVSTVFRRPDQIIQPWMFGHGETKKTCLWLKNLPKLQPTDVVDGRVPRVHRMPPRKDRWKLRSETYTGIAEAMAEQWGNL